MKKRLTTAEERLLFESGLEQIRPAPAKARPAGSSVKAARPAKTRPAKQRHPEARLDLHGFTEAEAHRALLAFLRGAHKGGLRLVAIVTGKGIVRAPDAPYEMRPRGVLKNSVPRWLNEKPFAVLVTGVESAPRHDGGEGALYVRIKA